MEDKKEKEMVEIMEVQDELEAMYENSLADFDEGQIIKGKIIQIGAKEIMVDVGYKSEGIIYKSEISEPEELELGDTIDVMVESKENDYGMVVLSHEKARRFKGWQNIVENQNEGDTIEGKVSRKVRGGFMVDIGMEAFLPASLSMMRESGGADSILGEKLTFKIVKINLQRKNIVLSRKEIVDELRRDEKREILGKLTKGDIIKGIVRNITDFGAFVDIGGGITALLHITDMSWGRINHPSAMVTIGDELEVKVLDFDKETTKVSLGLKQKTENPWKEIIDKYPEGTVVKGKVVNIMPYGVFVELEKGIEGLIHISEFSWSKKFSHPGEKFNAGDEVEAMVLKIDKESQKLSLGIKQLEQNPWEGVEGRYSVGDQIKGTINALTDYGAFIELETGVEGLLHVSDLSWTKRVNHPSEVLTMGDKVDAVILNINEKNRRIALGIKQLEENPWDEIVKKYEPGKICEGVITNITNFGVFVEMENDLEGLLHVSEMEPDVAQKVEEIFKVGQKITLKIIHIDGIQRKIALSQKGLDSEVQSSPDSSASAEEPLKEDSSVPTEEPLKEDSSVPTEEPSKEDSSASTEEPSKEDDSSTTEDAQAEEPADKKEESGAE